MGSSYFDNLWAFIIGGIFILFSLWEAGYRSRRWLVIPRIMWILMACFIVAELNSVVSEEWSEPSVIKAFYDLSDSVQQLPERKEQIQEFQTAFRDWAKQERQPIQEYYYTDLLKSGDLDWNLGNKYVSSLSAIRNSINSEEGSNILISDGNFENHDMLMRPVQTLSLNSEDEKDIWIDRLPAVFTAFLKNRIKIPFEIAQEGFTGESVKVELLRANEVVQTKTIRLNEASNLVELSYFPEKMGEEYMAVRVQSLDGELSALNNTAAFELRTVRDKIRILHIGGKPSVDLKAWRMFLTRQPDVDLVSFYILRSLNDDPEASNEELSLIPFPYDELFTTELEKFDIVILQNFNFSLYFQPFYLRNLANFVESGGGLLMIGGDQSFHRYALSPLMNIIPFQIDLSSLLETGSFAARILEPHPITNSIEWAFTGIKWGTRHRLKALPGADDLVGFDDGTPLLSIKQAGEGRAVGFNTDESWRMQFENFSDYPPFSRFARRILQYLTFDPLMEKSQIVSTRWKTNTKVNLRLNSSDKADWSVKSLYWNQNFQISFSQKNQIEFDVPSAGVYLVENSKLKTPVIYMTEEQPWRNEWKSLLTNAKQMNLIANQTRGQSYQFNQYRELFNKALGGRQKIASETKVWLRFSKNLVWTALLLTLALLCLDFFLRKKFRWDA